MGVIKGEECTGSKGERKTILYMDKITTLNAKRRRYVESPDTVPWIDTDGIQYMIL